MLNSLPSRKRHERDGKEDLAGAWETRTIGSGLRGHSDDQIRSLKRVGSHTRDDCYMGHTHRLLQDNL